MTWKEGSLQNAAVRSLAGKMCKIRTASPITIVKGNTEIARSGELQRNQIYSYYEVEFPTAVNETYQVCIVK